MKIIVRRSIVKMLNMVGSHDSRFALSVFSDDGEIERYNVFNVAMLVRHDEDGKYYLYDIMKIKKETSNLFQSDDFTQ